MHNKISKSLFISSFIRTFFVQAVWNFERMQNVGFAYVMLPFIRKYYPDMEGRKKALTRHLEFFNTHPYMVGIILGIVADMESDKTKESGAFENDITLLKTSMAGPLAAIGDTFFWATWKPFSAILASSLILVFHDSAGFAGTWLPPVLFLALFNIVHLPFRYWSMWLSYQYRTRTINVLASFNFQNIISYLRNAGLILLLLISAYYIFAFSTSIKDMLIFFGVFAAAVALAFSDVPPFLIYYIVIAASIVCSVLNMVVF